MEYKFKLVLVFSILLLVMVCSIPLSLISPLTAYAKISKDTIGLYQGEAMKAEFQSKKQTPIKQVSILVWFEDSNDPFTSYRMPITVEVYEKNQLVGSEHVSYTIGGKSQKVRVDVNNDPMIRGNYKIVVRHDIPEGSEDDDSKLFVDVDSIKFNKGKNNIYQHGKIKIFS